MIVLDSSAMLAYLRGEPGGDLVRGLLLDDERDVPIYAHAVNLCEVYYDVLQSHDATLAEATVTILKAAGVQERSDMDSVFWRDAATLIGTQRAAGHRLARGDAFGLALARREDADFYTTDRHEIAPVQAAGWCRVTFIR
ncbi:MAG TPA: PIN domain-containing protein [Abditibacteriaceae bacterium]|jgi:PIN domain nuclease of toxin-antitoxin system